MVLKEEKEMKIVILVAFLAIVFTTFNVAFLQGRESSNNSEVLAYYQQTYLREQGSFIGFGQYELRSFDGGKRWYATERDEEGAMMILGTAEEVFPSLLSRIHGMRALLKRAAQNDPLTLSGEQAEADRTLLESAGFTITEK